MIAEVCGEITTMEQQNFSPNDPSEFLKASKEIRTKPLSSQWPEKNPHRSLAMCHLLSESCPSPRERLVVTGHAPQRGLLLTSLPEPFQNHYTSEEFESAYEGPTQQSLCSKLKNKVILLVCPYHPRGLIKGVPSSIHLWSVLQCWRSTWVPFAK